MNNKKQKRISIDDAKNCCGCASCRNICPKSAISMEEDSEGFCYPSVNDTLCIECGLCRKACPILEEPAKNKYLKTYGGYASNEKEQMSSSSGGVFALLARQVLRCGGYVCGAAFSADFSVKHIIINSEDELYRLKGTKYVQSEIGTCFSEIKELLQSGNKVLFSGTPCQVAGLKLFLGKEYELLITVDLICHGVPSPLVWQKYLGEISKGEEISEVNFRHKDENGSRIKIVHGGQTLCEKNTENTYLQGFLKNYYVRPSCFNCRFKGFQRCSDITLGDFWGVIEYHPNFSNGKGTSAILVHSTKGQMILDQLADALQIIEVPQKELELWNENLLMSAEESAFRSEFYTNWKRSQVAIPVQNLLAREVASKPQRRSLVSKVISRIKSII